MHRGVQEFIRWVRDNPTFPGLRVNPPATAADIAALEQQLGVPLPADLRFVLSRFNGGAMPSGMLLQAGTGPGTVEHAVRRFAEQVGADFLDPELPLPFHRTNEGSLLAFDRSAAPVSDTWPIVDYYEDTGETRLVYRTFDGWCRSCVAEWTAADFSAEFSLEKYLRQGQRHVSIEPDVSTAHATVAHALRRAGEPEKALESYLRAARCVPPLPWCDWEALKLAGLLGRAKEALEAATRVAARAPQDRWRERETTPGRVAEVLARVVAQTPSRAPWLRILEALFEQADEEADRDQIRAVRDALQEGRPIPPPHAIRDRPVVTPVADVDAFWHATQKAYLDGRLRDEDMLFDASLRPIDDQYGLSQLLRLRREF